MRRPDMGLHHRADAAPAHQPLARAARLPVDAEEAHMPVGRHGEADAEIDQRHRIDLVVDLHQRGAAARQFEIDARGRGGKLAFAQRRRLQGEDRSRGLRHLSPPDRRRR